jgi:alpha-amylase
MLKLLLKLVRTEPRFKFSFSVSGVWMEQALAWTPDIVKLLQALASYPDQVEILAENYYHSLAALYSEREFAQQIRLHAQLMKDVFGIYPQIFRNTELIYNNYIAWQVAELGYKGILAEGVDRLLAGKGQKTQIWASNTGTKRLPVLLKHAALSDDIAFRFSQKSWASWPLTAEKYQAWISRYQAEDYLNLFMDFETFGEHQWASTGIFEFFAAWVKLFLQFEFDSFVLPSQEAGVKMTKLARAAWLEKLPVYDVTEPTSWADENRELCAWRSNIRQPDTLNQIFALEQAVLASGDEALLQSWRRLLTSDHFYYMCTKYHADGDVHAYFSAYDSPFEAYRRYCVVLSDLVNRVKFKEQKAPVHVSS